MGGVDTHGNEIMCYEMVYSDVSGDVYYSK